jgi:hypothetical protein
MLTDDEKWFAVSLRFVGLCFDPKTVGKTIGIDPTSIRIAGEKWKGKNGKEYGPASTNVWCYEVAEPDEMGFEEKINILLSEISKYSYAIKRLAGTDGVNAEIFCGFGSGNGQGGDTISALTLERIASLGLSLGLDLYPPDIDDNPEQIR